MTKRVHSKAENDRERGAGAARLTFLNVGSVDASEVKLTIDRGTEKDAMLGEGGWRADRHAVTLPVLEAKDGNLVVAVGPSLTQYLRAGTTLQLELSTHGGAPGFESALAWPAISGATVRGSRRRGVTLGGGQKPADESKSVEPPPPPPAPDKTDDQGGSPPGGDADDGMGKEDAGTRTPPGGAPAGGRKTGLVLAVVLGGLLIIGGGAAAYFLWPGASVPEATVWEQDAVRDFLRGDPDPTESLEQARKQLESGKVDMAFLLFKQAAAAGLPEARTALGRMYDPALFSPETSALPEANGAIAAEHYRQAAEAGEAFAQRRLGMMLVEGTHGGAPDIEAGRAMLEKAAEAGDEAAAEYLERM